MNEYRSLLERVVRPVSMPEPAMERMLRRRDRKRRNQRVTAAIVALAVAAVAVGGVERAFRTTPRETPAAIGPDNVADLRVAWSADVPDFAGGSPTVGGGLVLVRAGNDFTAGPGHARLYAFPTSCGAGGATCRPTWLGETGDEVGSGAVGNGLVYVWGGDCTLHAGGGGALCYGKLYAFSVACRTDGKACAPTWRANKPLHTSDQLVAVPGAVIAGGAVFPAWCSRTDCRPIWVDRRYDGSGPPVLDGDTLLMPENSGVSAYSVSCVVAGGRCDPLWTYDRGGAIAAYDGSVAVVGRRNLSLLSGCPTDGSACAPTWTATPPGGGSFQPGCSTFSLSVSAQAVYVTWAAPGYLCGSAPSNRLTLSAYPLDCRTDGGVCEPRWTATFGFLSPAVADGGNVYVTSGGKLYAFPEACRGQPCEPRWTADGTGTPVAENGLVFVASGEELLAYAADCGSGGATCDPVWRATVGAGAHWPPVIVGDALYLTVDGRVSAYTVDGGAPGA